MEPARVIVGDAKSTEGKIWQVLIPKKGGGTAISIMGYIGMCHCKGYRWMVFQAVYTAIG